MNENIRIRVTDYADTGMSVEQGTMDGAINSAVSLDHPVVQEFADIAGCDSNTSHTVAKYYHPMDIFHPIIFMDDLNKISPDIASATRI